MWGGSLKRYPGLKVLALHGCPNLSIHGPEIEAPVCATNRPRARGGVGTYPAVKLTNRCVLISVQVVIETNVLFIVPIYR